MTVSTPSLRPPPLDLLRSASLFLDFDGTLVDIAPRPQDVSVSTELRRLLERLSACLDGRVAILTGRAATEVEQMLHPLTLPIGGQHGLDTVNAGSDSPIQRAPGLDSVVRDLRKLENEHPGVLVEDKPLGVALHFRGAPQAEESCRVAIEEAAERSGLEIQPGKMVFELKPAGGNKGEALGRLMAKEPFAGSRPVFLGDDLTDEPAFAAAQAMGGAGVLIGDRSGTVARYRLDSVEEVLEWLRSACESLPRSEPK